MKYKKQEKVQDAKFTCLEELKCDIIENLLSLIDSSTDEVFGFITIIIKKDKAIELFNKLSVADVNGFNFDIEILDEDTNGQDVCLIEVTTDGKLILENIYPEINIESDSIYIDNDINSLWFRKINTGYNDILIFDIED